MLFQRWFTVGPTVNQRRANILCLLGSCTCNPCHQALTQCGPVSITLAQSLTTHNTRPIDLHVL